MTHYRGADSADAEQMLPQQSVLVSVKNSRRASTLVSQELILRKLTEASDAMQHSN
jgi:hypothetical protein